MSCYIIWFNMGFNALESSLELHGKFLWKRCDNLVVDKSTLTELKKVDVGSIMRSMDGNFSMRSYIISKIKKK